MASSVSEPLGMAEGFAFAERLEPIGKVPLKRSNEIASERSLFGARRVQR